MIYFLLITTNPDTSNAVLNLKEEIENSTLAKFGNNVNYLLDEMSSNYYIIIDKGELHKDYVCHIFRFLLSDTNSNLNCFIESTKGNWYKGTEIPAP